MDNSIEKKDIETKKVQIYIAHYEQKSVVLAYILLIFFGLLGLHRFYTKRPGTGIIIILLLTSFLIIPLIILVIWNIYDLFTLYKVVEKINTQSLKKICRETL